MNKTVYVYDDFRDPGNSMATTSITQISEIVKIKERVLARRLNGCNVYADPGGRFKVMRVPYIADGRKNNGDENRFSKRDI